MSFWAQRLDEGTLLVGRKRCLILATRGRECAVYLDKRVRLFRLLSGIDRMADVTPTLGPCLYQEVDVPKGPNLWSTVHFDPSTGVEEA